MTLCCKGEWAAGPMSIVTVTRCWHYIRAESRSARLLEN